jgi:hypothetical protein
LQLLTLLTQQQREQKLADVHTAAASRAGSRVTSRAGSLNNGPGNGAANPGAAAEVAGAEGPTAPGVGVGPAGAAA